MENILSIVNQGRHQLINPHGLIVGSSGTGKTLINKRNIIDVMFDIKDVKYEKKDDITLVESKGGEDITIISSKSEYNGLAEDYSGDIVKISMEGKRGGTSLLDIEFDEKIDSDKGITIYDLSEIEESNKKLGIVSVLRYVYKKIKSNSSKGKRTRIFIDDSNCFSEEEDSLNILWNMYRRLRPYGGILTLDVPNINRWFLPLLGEILYQI